MKARSFDPRAGVVHVQVRLTGPGGEGIFTFALDTGATRSMLSWEAALQLGCAPGSAAQRVEIVTGSGVEYCPEVRVGLAEALGVSRTGFPMLCHNLPPQAKLQGLLGLDFLEGRVLTADFRKGRISLK